MLTRLLFITGLLIIMNSCNRDRISLISLVANLASDTAIHQTIPKSGSKGDSLLTFFPINLRIKVNTNSIYPKMAIFLKYEFIDTPTTSDVLVSGKVAKLANGTYLFPNILSSGVYYRFVIGTSGEVNISPYLLRRKPNLVRDYAIHFFVTATDSTGTSSNIDTTIIKTIGPNKINRILHIKINKNDPNKASAKVLYNRYNPTFFRINEIYLKNNELYPEPRMFCQQKLAIA